MKFIILILCMSSFVLAQHKTNSSFCRTMKAWYKNQKMTGEEICHKAGTFPCGSVKSVPEGICRAGKGSSCNTAQDIGEGICKALKLGSCSFYSEKMAIKKLKKTCNIF